MTTLKPIVPSLTGLRFMAAMAVVSSHIMVLMLNGPQNRFYLVLGSFSGLGMSLFFVLSGYVIHANYSNVTRSASDLWNFFVARFARLYPLFFLVACYEILLGFGYDQLTWERVRALPFFFTLTQSWFYRPTDTSALIYQAGGHALPVTWSISTEWFFYLVFPAIAVALSLYVRTARQILLTIAALCVFGIIGSLTLGAETPSLSALANVWFGPVGADQQNGMLRWLAYFSPYVRVFEFALGCFVSALIQSLPEVSDRERSFNLFTTLSAVAGVLVLHVVIFGLHMPGTVIALHMNFGYAPFLALIVFCCARYDNIAIRALSEPHIVLAGETSYSIYLSHMVVINAFRYEAPTVTGLRTLICSLTLISATMAAILGVSFLLWRGVEMPSRRLIRRVLSINPETVLEPEKIAQQAVE